MCSDRDEARLSAERAVVSGITYFDKAASYGDGLSETNLLRDLRAEEQVKVGTKIRVSGEEIGRIEELTVSSSEVSPKCLGREQIDLMQPMDYPDSAPLPLVEKAIYNILRIFGQDRTIQSEKGLVVMSKEHVEIRVVVSC